jgi:CubicO group peptidase (beta-lactamase class C family)
LRETNVEIPRPSFPHLWIVSVALALCALPSAFSEGWSVRDPASLGLNVEAIERYRTLCERSGADACLVAFRGAIVLEWYGPSYREPIYTMSSVKSWTALVVGLLIAEGRMQSIEDPVAKYIPEWRQGASAGVTIRDLLTMTAGLDARNARSGPRQSVGYALAKDPFVLGLPLDHEPGTQWAYSNESAQLLSPIIDRACGTTAAQYARERLFEPAGMARTRLHEYPEGQTWTYADAETTLRDFARIGQLVLDGGKVDGGQLIPSDWISRCLTPTRQNRNYGLMWWLDYPEEVGIPGAIARAFPELVKPRPARGSPTIASTQGYLNTDCYVLLKSGVVAARMQMKEFPDRSLRYRRSDALRLLEGIVPSTE